MAMRSFAKVYEIIISIRREFVLEIILILLFFFLSNLIFFEEYRSQSVAERRLALQPQFTALDDGHKRNNCVYRYSPKVCPSSAEPQMEPIPPPKPRLKRPLLAPFQRDYVSDFGKSIILSVGRIRAKKLFGRNAILNFDD